MLKIEFSLFDNGLDSQSHDLMPQKSYRSEVNTTSVNKAFEVMSVSFTADVTDTDITIVRKSSNLSNKAFQHLIKCFRLRGDTH